MNKMETLITLPKKNYFDARDALEEVYKSYRSNQSLSPDDTSWRSGRIFSTGVNTFSFPIRSRVLKSLESLVFIIPIVSKTTDHELKELCATISPPEVENFCKEQGLERALKTYKNVTCRIFKDASAITLSLSEDPEIKNYFKVCFNIKIEVDIPSLLTMDKEFFRAIDSIIPDYEKDSFVKTFEIIE